jgi:probable phosphoglycerate mutase
LEIFLLRHAQPDWEPDDCAVDDPALTALGREQAQRSADALASLDFDALYASPLLRSQQSAAPLEKALQQKPVTLRWLREIELPSLAGRSSEEVTAYFAAARSRELSAWWDGLPGGESFRHFQDRIAAGIEALLSDHHRVEIHEPGEFRLWQLPAETERLLITAHEGTNAAILSHLLGLPAVPFAWMRFSTAWSGITKLRSIRFPGGAAFALEYFNRTDHLADLEAGVGGHSQ